MAGKQLTRGKKKKGAISDIGMGIVDDTWSIGDVPDVQLPEKIVDEDDNGDIVMDGLRFGNEDNKGVLEDEPVDDWYKGNQETNDVLFKHENLSLYTQNSQVDAPMIQQPVLPNYLAIIEEQNNRMQQMNAVIENMKAEQKALVASLNESQSTMVNALQQLSVSVNNRSDINAVDVPTMPQEQLGEQSISAAQANKLYEFIGIAGNFAQQIAPILQTLIKAKQPESSNNLGATSLDNFFQQADVFMSMQDKLVSNVETWTKRKMSGLDEQAIIEKIAGSVLERVNEVLNKGGAK